MRFGADASILLDKYRRVKNYPRVGRDDVVRGREYKTRARICDAFAFAEYLANNRVARGQSRGWETRGR